MKVLRCSGIVSRDVLIEHVRAALADVPEGDERCYAAAVLESIRGSTALEGVLVVLLEIVVEV